MSVLSKTYNYSWKLILHKPLKKYLQWNCMHKKVCAIKDINPLY